MECSGFLFILLILYILPIRYRGCVSIHNNEHICAVSPSKSINNKYLNNDINSRVNLGINSENIIAGLWFVKNKIKLFL